MYKILLPLVVMLIASNALAQNPVDSMEFCKQSNWKIIHNQKNIKVKKFQNNDRNKLFILGNEIPAYLLALKSPLIHDTVLMSMLFDTVQSVYLIEVNPVEFNIVPRQMETKQKVSSLAKDANAVAAVNGGFFVVDKAVGENAIANDFLKINGVVCSPTQMTGWGNAAVGFDKNSGAHFATWASADEMKNTIVNWSTPYPNVMAAGPMLILDNKKLFGWENINKKKITNSQKSNIYAPRTAVGNREDGTIVFLVADGRGLCAYGLSFAEMATLGKWLNLSNMLNLDGGGSSTMVFGSELMNIPSDGMGLLPFERRVANALLIMKKEK